MHKKLEEIIYKTKKDLLKRKEKESFHDLKSLIIPQKERSFIQAIKKSEKGTIAVIAEIKLASPNEKSLGSKKDVRDRVAKYEQADINAISVVTEQHFFKGDPMLIREIKQVVSIPILQKDFIVDSYQLYEAKRAGADAILLIARILSGKELKVLVNLANKLRVEPVVEINDKKDLKKAIITKTKIIAANARNLDTFEIDVNKACELIEEIPSKFIKLAFSGVKGKEEMIEYRNAGADGVLIGTGLMKSRNISEFLEGLSV